MPAAIPLAIGGSIAGTAASGILSAKGAKDAANQMSGGYNSAISSLQQGFGQYQDYLKPMAQGYQDVWKSMLEQSQGNTDVDYAKNLYSQFLRTNARGTAASGQRNSSFAAGEQAREAGNLAQQVTQQRFGKEQAVAQMANPSYQGMAQSYTQLPQLLSGLYTGQGQARGQGLLGQYGAYGQMAQGLGQDIAGGALLPTEMGMMNDTNAMMKQLMQKMLGKV